MANDQAQATGKRSFLGLERPERRFWLKWVLATVVGGAVGGLVGVFADAAAGVFAGLVVGWTVAGAAQ